jgi:hypothetical protein
VRGNSSTHTGPDNHKQRPEAELARHVTVAPEESSVLLRAERREFGRRAATFQCARWMGQPSIPLDLTASL